MALRLLLLLGLLKVATAFHCKMSEAEKQNAKSFEEFEHLFEKDLSAFTKGVFGQVSDNAPGLEDLIEMTNEISKGNIPRDMQELQYTLGSNYTADYSSSEGDTAVISSLTYGVFNITERRNFYDLMQFTFTKGKIETFKYTVVNALYSRVDYMIRENTIQWLATTYGLFLAEMPNGKYFPYGNITAASGGNAVMHSDTASSFSITTVDITDTEMYSSNTVTSIDGSGQFPDYRVDMDMHSLTGGTNATFQSYSVQSSEANEIYGYSNGTLFNSDRAATVEVKGKEYTPFDKENPFGENTLRQLFNNAYHSVGLYLP